MNKAKLATTAFAATAILASATKVMATGGGVKGGGGPHKASNPMTAPTVGSNPVQAEVSSRIAQTN